MVGQQVHVRDDLACHPPPEAINGDSVRTGSATGRIVAMATLSVSDVVRTAE
jgi:hypothetical protein